jgi:hypothetical protein
MAQNTSSAVMQQRKEPTDSLDYFPTHPWATRAFIEYAMIDHGWSIDQLKAATVWECACGEGHMAMPLAEYFQTVYATDVHPYGYGGLEDFLFPGKAPFKPDFIFTNPPFVLAIDFIFRALDVAEKGVVMFTRTSFLESQSRYNNLFSVCPPTYIAQYAERVPLLKGRLEEDANSATSYCVLVWNSLASCNAIDPLFKWIPPCSEQMKRPGDYDLPVNMPENVRIAA